MQMKKGIAIGILLLALIPFPNLVQAAGEEKVALISGPDGKGAHGEATIKEKGPDQREITVHATGLKPNSVYTVWLVKMQPKMDMIGVGEGDYSFKSDGKGDGHYVGMISAAELSKWEMFEIARHPDGDPKNMKKMGIVLTGDLKK